MGQPCRSTGALRHRRALGRQCPASRHSAPGQPMGQRRRQQHCAPGRKPQHRFDGGRGRTDRHRRRPERGRAPHPGGNGFYRCGHHGGSERRRRIHAAERISQRPAECHIGECGE